MILYKGKKKKGNKTDLDGKRASFKLKFGIPIGERRESVCKIRLLSKAFGF